MEERGEKSGAQGEEPGGNSVSKGAGAGAYVGTYANASAGVGGTGARRLRGKMWVREWEWSEV